MEKNSFTQKLLASSKELRESKTLKEIISDLKSEKTITNVQVGSVTRYRSFTISYKINGISKGITIKCPLLEEGDKPSLTLTVSEDSFKKGNYVAF